MWPRPGCGERLAMRLNSPRPEPKTPGLGQEFPEITVDEAVLRIGPAAGVGKDLQALAESIKHLRLGQERRLVKKRRAATCAAKIIIGDEKFLPLLAAGG